VITRKINVDRLFTVQANVIRQLPLAFTVYHLRCGQEGRVMPYESFDCRVGRNKAELWHSKSVSPLRRQPPIARQDGTSGAHRQISNRHTAISLQPCVLNSKVAASITDRGSANTIKNPLTRSP
jgi:hypothetical protein